MAPRRSPSPPPVDIFDDDDEEGWQDMPVVHEDELRGGLDEEDQRKYHYRPDPRKDKDDEGLPSLKLPGNGNATGTTLDTDERGYRWRSNPMASKASNSYDFHTESKYTRLRHVEEDWDEGDQVIQTSQYLFNSQYSDSESYLDDHKAITPLSQMQQTKNLLSESQKIAYVGLVGLATKKMIGEVSAPETVKRKVKERVKVDGDDADGKEYKWITKFQETPTGKIKKEFRGAAKSMELWAMKIMGRLYYHIQLEGDEQKMIESLSIHGVQPSDLVPPLIEMKEVPNPEYTENGYESSTNQADDTNGDQDPKWKPPKTILLDMRYTLLTDLFLILIADSVYDARSRSLLFRIGIYLGLTPWETTVFEGRIVEAVGIQEETAESGLQQNKTSIDAQVRALRNRRIALLGLATLGGGLVIGLSAGLLAPVIGVGLGTAFSTIGITGASTFLAGAGGAAVITTGGVLTGAGIAGKGMHRRTQVVRVFDVLPLHKNGRVGCILSVPGFLNGPLDDPRLPFSVLDPVVGDVFSVLWEPEMIRETGSALKILTGEVLTQIGQTVLQATVMATLMTALQWPIILTKLGYLIDNPWSNALDRARAAGLVLASVLRERQLGVRPITLVGFSLGARVIFYALLDLAKTGSYGIVQDVFLLGATVSVSSSMWEQTKSVVGGRFVNVYARNDWVLNYLFRASSAVSGNVSTVAGLRPIEGVQGVENVDVTDKIAGHMSYRVYMPVILEELGFKVTGRYFDEVEEPDFEGDRVVVTEEPETEKKGWFGRRKAKRQSTNMSSRTNIQRPPSYATWADKGKENAKSKPSSAVTADDEDLPPREGARADSPIHHSGSDSRSSTPTPNDPKGTENSASTNLPKTAGFDLAAIKAELEETKAQVGGSEADSRFDLAAIKDILDSEGSDLKLKLDDKKVVLPAMETPRIRDGSSNARDDDPFADGDGESPPTPPEKSPVYGDRYSNPSSASLAYNPFASAGLGGEFSLANQIPTMPSAGLGSGFGSSFSFNGGLDSAGVRGGSGLSFGGADGSISLASPDPWAGPSQRRERENSNPWG